MVQHGIAEKVEDAGTQPSGGLTDRRVGGLLFAFFFALYLLTASGHLYSPDGEFAFRVARSIGTEPKHEYLVKQQRDLTQWGIMVPILSQPFILLGQPLASAMPQKDEAAVDGQNYVLGAYREHDLPPDAPTVGPEEPGVRDVYTRSNFPAGQATALTLISFLSLAKDVPQDTVVAEITVSGTDGSQVTLPVRAGVETAEWSRGRASPPIAHQMARVASTWSGNTSGRNFYAEIPLGRSVEVKSLSIRYIAPEGKLFVRSLAFIDAGSGAAWQVSADYREWSPRENDEYFALIFYAGYNALVTALTCLVLFAMVRLLGYGQRVAAIATLLYGLATIAWPYSKYDFTEPTLTLLVSTTLYLILRWGQSRRNRLLFAAAIVSLMAAVTKYVAAILIPVMLLQVVLIHWSRAASAETGSHGGRRLPGARASGLRYAAGDEPPALRNPEDSPPNALAAETAALPAEALEPSLRGMVRPLLAFLAPFLALAAPGIYYLSTRYGYSPSIFEAWAGIQRGWLPLPFDIGLRGLLFSPGRSFFLYSPPAILALIAAVPFVRRHGVRAFAILGIILIYFVLYSKKVAWDAGAGWGPRYQVVIVPLVILIAADLIEKAIEHRVRWAQYALLAAFVLGFGIQMLAVPKNFNNYLGIFRDRIVTQMPDKGARYGGADYYPHAEGLTDHNRITATVWAPQFSPILAHAWLLASDAFDLGRPYLQGYEAKLLGMPPWRMMGVDILPANPEHGLGFDFWSTRLFIEFPSRPVLLAGVMLVLLVLESAIILLGARVVAFLLGESRLWSGLPRLWLIASAAAFLLFDVIHILV